MATGSFSFAATALLMSAAGQAQQSDNREVVVTAPRAVTVEDARRRIDAIDRRSDGQFARFNDPICPGVFGMQVGYAVLVEKRVRAIASDVGARVAEPGCETNIFIFMSDNPRATLRALDRKGVLRDLSDAVRDRMMEKGVPARAWSDTEIANEDGIGESQHLRVQGGNGQWYDMGRTLHVRTASIINTSSRQVFDRTFVVFDNRALIGLKLRQIADYAAMRTLADTKPPDPDGPATDTILTLFEADRQPSKGLTFFDREYLKALYRGNPTQRGTMQAAAMANSISDASRGASKTR